MDKLIVELDFIEFPLRHTCDGEDISPQITIRGLRMDVISLAIFAVNPYEAGCSHTAWVAWNIEPSPVIPAGFPKKRRIHHPIAALQGTSDDGRVGYSGPCPPAGETHRFFFKVYGLDRMLDAAPGADKRSVIHAMEGCVLQYGDTVAMYRRQ